MKKFAKVVVLLILLCVTLCTFTACGEKNISFVVDGEEYAVIKTGGKQTLVLPSTPQKSGYVFDGWYCDDGVWEEEFNENSLIDTQLSEDITVYAKFTKSEILFNTFSVDNLSVDGGIKAFSVTSFDFNEEIAVKGDATYDVSLDEFGIQISLTKVVPLNEGDNTFYVFEKVEGEIVNTYTVEIYRRHNYTVTFNTLGGVAVSPQNIEEGSLVQPATTSGKLGYTFVGWDYDFSTPVTSDITITAEWSANTDTGYKVEYYLQNLEDDNYTLSETVNKTGTTDTTANIIAKDIEHFTYNASISTASGNIAGDGSLVLKLYYTRNSYTVTFDANGGTLVSGSANQTVKYGGSAIAPTFSRPGYTFTGFDKTFDNITEAITITAEWSENTDTAYKVEYYLQNLEDNNYTLSETLNKTGTTDTTANITAKDIEHFTYNARISTASGNITGDGSLVVKLYYTRNSYTVTFDANGGTLLNGSANQTVKYGGSAIAPTFSRSGYTFTGFDIAFDNITEAITVTAEWSAIFTRNGGTITGLTTYGENNYTEIEIPSHIDGDEITSIDGYAFSACTSLTSITIPSSVTSIGKYAFRDCDSLEEVVLDDNSQLESIGDGAFEYCFSLTSITIPSSVTSIGSYAFFDCLLLTIYCEAESKPSGWNSDWDIEGYQSEQVFNEYTNSYVWIDYPYYHSVIWGYKG